MAEALTTKTFRFDLVSPEKVLFSGDATIVTIPGEGGEFGVLAGHAPLLSSLRPGVVSMTSPDGKVTRVFVAGGFADVSNNVCAVLAEEAVGLGDIDRAGVEKQIASLNEDLSFAKDDAIKAEGIRQQIAVAQAKLQAVSAVA